MANHALFTKRLTNSGWVITGKVTEASAIPRDVFVYENTGLPTLGKFHSVCMVSDMPRIRVWAGEAIPTSVSKYVRFSSLSVEVPPQEDVDDVLGQIVSSLKGFVADYQTTQETTVSYVLD